jgi:hypothetical protein
MLIQQGLPQANTQPGAPQPGAQQAPPQPNAPAASGPKFSPQRIY